MGWNEYFGGEKTLFLRLETIVLSKLRKERNNAIYRPNGLSIRPIASRLER